MKKSVPHSTEQPRRRWWLRLAVFIVIVLSAGALFAAVAEYVERASAKPPGSMIALQDKSIHLDCEGSARAKGAPTVILEAASGGMAASWGWVQAAIAKEFRVCAYDRSGRGYSTGESRGLDAEQVAADLHAVLQKAAIGGPYVLVGHSIGGLYARTYQARYPAEVKAIVLLDASHPDQLARVDGVAQRIQQTSSEYTMLSYAAQLGILRTYIGLGGQMDFDGLPAAQRRDMAMFWSRGSHFVSMRDENEQLMRIYAQTAKLDGLGSLPLRVISAEKAINPEWEMLQRDQLNLSTDSGRTVIAGSDHMSLVFNRDHAGQVSRQIIGFIQAVH